MKTFLEAIFAFAFINGMITTITSLIIKLELKDHGKNVTFLYNEFSDIREYYKIRKEHAYNPMVFYLYIISGSVTIVGFIFLIIYLAYFL